eukprot:NODE_1652_length_781_cov_60.073394_g1603_i0.p1 GENE.NODE_1652_length_781_cov_60.073394_g1603_i0~~NODE_1652_length_781_cov_60.073394_g1603_i0.p1  ORF type:complete len:205 (-),score=56.55 NODE_1652_length_781_cov_60.073394_g1603_i0:86-700(-)
MQYSYGSLASPYVSYGGLSASAFGTYGYDLNGYGQGYFPQQQQQYYGSSGWGSSYFGASPFTTAAQTPAAAFVAAEQARSAGASATAQAAPAAAAAAPAAPRSSKQVIVVGQSRIDQGKRQDALKAIDELVQATRAEKGCVKYEWCQCLEDPYIMNIFECWQSEDDLNRHLDSEHVNAFKRVVRDLFAVDPAVQKGEITEWEDI